MDRPTSPALHLSALTLRTAPFTTRLSAAAAAGYDGIGLGAYDYLDARRSGLADNELREALDAAGLVVVELEFLRDWWTDADVRGMRLEEDLLLQLAGLVGAQQLNAGLFDDVPHDVALAGFRRLCDRAADHGLRVGLEHMPYSALRTLADARRLVEEAGAPNAGLVVDAWHWHRAATPAGQVADAVAAGLVVSVQLGDAAAEPMADLRTEGRHHRLLPGEGAADLPALLAELEPVLGDGQGAATVAVEVLSDDLEALGARESCRRTARAGRRVLAQVQDRSTVAA